MAPSAQDLMLDALQRVERKLESMDEKWDRVSGDLYSKINRNSVDLAGVKVKSGVWGAIAGIIPVALGLAYLMFKGLP